MSYYGGSGVSKLGSVAKAQIAYYKTKDMVTFLARGGLRRIHGVRELFRPYSSQESAMTNGLLC